MIKKQISNFLKALKLFSLFLIIFTNISYAESNNEEFQIWLSSYKQKVIKRGISQKTVNTVFKNAKYLEKVIGYDRKQPEFFEDTITYVTKRANLFRKNKARELLKKNYELFTKVEKEFNVEKEILLALWGIETNFGKHVGKMDIISSLATLSFDKRRRDFFSNQLFLLLKLVDNQLIDPNKLYGSWAGAYGNFQFMPSTITNYAIDYDKNSKIELKSSLNDSVASAANYINSIGWNKGKPCFYRVKLKEKINKKFINKSAKKLKNKLKLSEWKKKGIESYFGKSLDGNEEAALIMPDGDMNSPSYLVFKNYEKILKWNRSLRFGISVCTLAEMIKT